jgi:hypothetical protein
MKRSPKSEKYKNIKKQEKKQKKGKVNLLNSDIQMISDALTSEFWATEVPTRKVGIVSYRKPN